MNLFKNLLQLADIRSISVSHPVAMNLLSQNNPEYDINESFISVHYSDIKSDSYAKFFLKYYSYLSTEQIKEMLPHIQFDKPCLSFNIEIYDRKKDIRDKTEKEVKEIMASGEIVANEDTTKAIGYNIFQYDKQSFQVEKFYIMYDEFKKVCPCDKKLLLSDYHSNSFFIGLLNDSHTEVLDKVLNDFGLTINDDFLDSPLYFHLNNNKMLKYIIDKNVDTTLRSNNNQDFTQHWLSQNEGTALIQEFGNMYKVDGPTMLNSYIKLDKNKAEIINVMQRINKDFYKIKIDGVPVFNKMIEYNNMKMISHLLKQYDFNTIISENTGYSPLYYYFLNKERLSQSLGRKKVFLLCKILEKLDVDLISSKEVKEIVSILLNSSRYQHNPLNINIENLALEDYKYMEKAIPYDKNNKIFAYLMKAQLNYEDMQELFEKFVLNTNIKHNNGLKNLFFISQLMSNSSVEEKNKAASNYLSYVLKYLKDGNTDSSLLLGLLSIVNLQPNKLNQSEIINVESLIKETLKVANSFEFTEKIEKFQLNLQITNSTNLPNKTLKI